VIIDKQKTGNRTFDLNNEGLAHYGLVADHIQDIREQTDQRIYDSVMNSAEAYLQMWERAEANSDTQYVNPFGGDYVSIVDRRSGKCMDIPGDDSNVVVGANVQIWDCQAHAQDQQWFYNYDDGSLKNKANQSLCLENTNPASNGGSLKLADCNGSAAQRFSFDGDVIRQRTNSNMVLDAFGNHNGANLGGWSHHGGSNQRWSRIY